jgi:hypothetical protein
MNADTHSQIMTEDIKQEKIRRAMLSGPSCVTSEATVAELNLDGSMTVLRPGTNEWICMPGDQHIVGATDMCADPMGMVWIMDLMAGKPKPTNTSPGLIYMLNGPPSTASPTRSPVCPARSSDALLARQEQHDRVGGTGDEPGDHRDGPAQALGHVPDPVMDSQRSADAAVADRLT